MSRNSRFNQKSDSPSTPNLKGKGSLFSQAPSTTPAGPPPSWLTNKSTTPAGPPPNSSRIFGSSYNASNNTFARKGGPFSGRQSNRKVFAVPESSPPRDDEDSDDEDEDADAEGEDDEMQDAHVEKDNATLNSMLMSSVGASPRGLKRSHNGKVRDHSESEVSAIARDLATQRRVAGLQGSDDVVLQTDGIVGRLDSSIRESGRTEHENLVTQAVGQLAKNWTVQSHPKTRSGVIGPKSQDPHTLANYVASLLLQLHHPHASKEPFSTANTRSQRGINAAKLGQSSTATAVPQALLDWLNTYHNPFSDDYSAVLIYQPAPSANDSFWDIIYSEMLRGRLERAIRLLKDASWEYAVSALDDGSGADGYEGKHLENTQLVAEHCIKVLESCPAVTDRNWDVRGLEWHLFRQRVRQAIADLESFAEGTDEDDGGDGSRANVFDLDGVDSLNMSHSTRRAESKVPWTIYQNLKVLYRQLLGEASFILEVCQDWLEASILMTVWWNGDEVKVNMNASLSNSLRKSMRAGTREVDFTPLLAYRQRLGDMFDEVLTQEDACFQPDTMDPLQVALACVLEDDVEGVIGLLRSYDQTIATAVVEVASLAGWLPLARPSSRGLLREGFSSEDLMVLSHGPGQKFQPSGSVIRDDILAAYAELLSSKDAFRSSDGKTEKEGWELAIAVLGRLDDTSAAQSKIAQMLEKIKLSDEGRLDKVLSACNEVGLGDHGRAIAERFADTRVETSQTYGAALILYARAHATTKLRNTIALLISLCLINSAATPADSQLDPQLASLLSHNRSALVDLARADPEAANLLSSNLSGYATVRRFYALRDQDVTASPASSNSNLIVAAPPTPRPLPPLERKREAAASLTALLESSADCIRGGLFDPAVESVIPVDAVLALLGEALPLLKAEKRIFTQDQVFALLRVVEDFETAPSRVKENATALVAAGLESCRGRGGATTSSSGRGGGGGGASSVEDLLGASSYDMLASSVMVTSWESATSGASGTGNKRAWDWRSGLDAVCLGADAEAVGRNVVALLRTALAREVARRWASGAKW